MDCGTSLGAPQGQNTKLSGPRANVQNLRPLPPQVAAESARSMYKHRATSSSRTHGPATQQKDKRNQQTKKNGFVQQLAQKSSMAWSLRCRTSRLILSPGTEPKPWCLGIKQHPRWTTWQPNEVCLLHDDSGNMHDL